MLQEALAAIGIVVALASFGGTWIAIRVHLRYLRRDVDRAHERLSKHDDRLRDLERIA